MAGCCVHVDPPFVPFNSVKVGKVYKSTVTVTNVGKTPKKILLEKPSLKLFKLTSFRSAQVVGPGLSLSGLLEFTPEQEEDEVRDFLLVHVDDVESIRVPVLGFPRACSSLRDSVLDFGCVAASSQVISRHHRITNQDSAPGVFQVQYNGDPSVRISPCSGVIAAGATQWLIVELCTDRPRQIEEKALLKLQSGPAAVLTVKAEVVDQHLEVFDLQGDPLSCLRFGPVYFGTSRLQNLVLRNHSPSACDWVCVLQDEVGVDLQRSSDPARSRCIPATRDVSQALVCMPAQGRLGPYEKTKVAVCFSPVFKSMSAERRRDHSPGRQDFCFFLLFDSVGSRYGFTHRYGNSSVELAVTGSGLPVSLLPSPSDRFEFPPCVTGRGADLLCVLQNLCRQLPISFRCHKLAHFTTEPSAGTIAPGQCQDVVLSFTARQQGSFQVCLKIDLLGHVMRTGDAVCGTQLHSFHTITLHLSAVCRGETTHPAPKLNPGITPAVSNPAGSLPHVRASDLALCRGMVRAAVLCADKTTLHKHRRERRENEGEELLAFPNDRTASIRPASVDTQYRTIFTGVNRYRYVDTSYAFTEEEEEQRRRQRQVYADFIEQLRRTRLQKISDRRQENAEEDVDIGIVPAQGLVPPKLCIRDLERSQISESKPDYTPNSSPVASINQVMSAVPSTSQEVADCNKTLTAQELYQVVIGPLLVDFGEVCVQSMCVHKLELINHLSAFVWVQLEVDCPELQGSSPLSHVLPPHSLHTLPLTFQSNKLGHFYRPVSFSVNQKHPGQIVVQAQVVPVALELSTTQLVLRPVHTSLAQSGYRSSVTLRNRRNQVAEFTWRPIVTENGILFSIRPATGTVEPFRELDCEVVWHPSFSSPAEGDFELCVHDGNTQRLHCVAKVGSTSVQLAEKRLTFGSAPLNTTSIRTAVLHNTGKHHAYYQVLDVCPLPGLLVTPPEGVVPTGGQATLEIHFTPDAIIKFDSRVEIALRNMKSIELRVGGAVEPPDVNISVSHFQFHGVHAGFQQALPFTLTNHSAATVNVTFDLSEYPDFSVHLPQPSAAEKEDGVSEVEVQHHQTVDCSLVFSPTHADSYDFDLLLMVNGVRWPYPLPTPSCRSSSSSSSSLSVVRPPPQSVAMAMQPSLRVQATVLCTPLELFPSVLQFHVEPQCDAHTKTVELKAARADSMFWRKGARKCINWWFGCGGHTECTVSPSSGSLGPGQSICLAVSVRPGAVAAGSGTVTKLSLLLYLGDEDKQGTAGKERPHRELSITINLQLPRITSHPPQILLTPVPLESTAAATLTLLASGYPRGTVVLAEVDEVELEDGTKMRPVSVVFPEGNDIPAQDQEQSHPVGVQDQEAGVTPLICSVTFCSAVPLSLCTAIVFTDHLHNSFKVKLCAIADNCVLTVWPYMALHRSEQQIVLKTGATAVEAILQRYQTPSPASAPTSSTSSSFDHSSSTNKNSVSSSLESIEEDSDSASSRASGSTVISPYRETPTNLGVPEFPAATSEEGLYYQNVLLAVERWFSLFGWPNGPHPISVPHTLRRVASKIQTNHSSGRTYRVSQNKDSRSVVDMLHHLTGKQIPGIPQCQTFAVDVDQRTKQLLQQHRAMLTFLRVQGARLCHVRPEYLLDVLEFKHWCSFLQLPEEEHAVDYHGVDYQSLSKRSWTDVLLQTYKVLVLCRVSVGGSNNETPNQDGVDRIVPVNSQPLASNVYSSHELRLLSWLNVHYQNMRKTVWGTGGVPSARWIVNFELDFTDGLVLATLLSAYCPYLICSHFRRMYTSTSSLEQILHNNIIVAQALTALGLNIDVQPTDLSDPNPVQMLILCAHLYERLPQYQPLQAISLSGGLHSTFSKQVRLKSPAFKPIKYQAFLLGEDAHHFSLPNGSAITVPPKSSAELAVQFSCSSMQPREAVLLLVSSSPPGPCSTALSFNLRTHVSHITPTNTIKCRSPCYQMKALQVPITNPFNKEASFRVVLVESRFNPLEPETNEDSLVLHASRANLKTRSSDESCGAEMVWRRSDVCSEFHSAVRSVCLTSGQAITLNIHFLPFCPGTKYCSVLLVCPQVGDLVFLVKALADLPLPSPLTARPSSNISSSSGPDVRVHCRVGQLCNDSVCVPLVNTAWEQALSSWAQCSMAADVYRRPVLTHALTSSTAVRQLFRQQVLGDFPYSQGVEYSVEVSMPQYFTFPSSVTIPIKEDTSMQWKHPADPSCVDVPFWFQADSVGHFTCQLVLRSWWDTRVYMLEAVVTSQRESVHLDFSSTAHRSVTQYIPLQNDTNQDWEMRAELSGEGFTGPKVLEVAAGTRVCYPLTFHPTAQCIVTGELSLHNVCNGTEHMFTLRGVGEPPLPVDHVVLRCSVGETTHSQISVPNYSQKQLTLQAVTDLFGVSGPPSLEVKPGHSAPYTLTVLSQKRGKHTGFVYFLEVDDVQEADENKGTPGRYEVLFSLEILCEPTAPFKVIEVQCAAQSSVAIEIPVKNPRGEPLMLDVHLEGGELSGDDRVSVPPRGTITYKATFSPTSVGKMTGSVVFHSEQLEEFWYKLELYALPPPVVTLPQACCQLGKWTRQNIPLVNPTSETLELHATNSNPRNYTLETDAILVEPKSSTQLGVRFRPSCIGEGNHAAMITLTCPQLQEWCVLLSGRGLIPATYEPLSVSATIGSNATVNIHFTNPTECSVVLDVTLTDEELIGAPSSRQLTTDVFSVLLSSTEGIQLSEGSSFDVPLMFAPKSMELQKAWLCITSKPCSSQNGSSQNGSSSFSADSLRSEHEPSTICWTYPIRGIPTEGPVENSPLGEMHCEAGRQLERMVDVLLTGCVPGNQDRNEKQASMAEDFLCAVGSYTQTEAEDCISVSAESVRRDPETGMVALTLNLVYTPLRPCRCSALVVVQCESGSKWEFPISLVSTEPRVDPPLSSTTRRREPFTTAFSPSSSAAFTVTPAPGTLRPAGSPGAPAPAASTHPHSPSRQQTQR